MLTRARRSSIIVAALLVWFAAPAGAASIALRPDLPLLGVPGGTIGWGYEITADPDRDAVIGSINADILSGSGLITLLFDFPTVAAGTSVFLDYDALLGTGLVELALAPGLSPGDVVTARVFGDLLRIDPTGTLPDLVDSFDLNLTATIAETSVPEPGTLLLVWAGGAALLRRRYRAR